MYVRISRLMRKILQDRTRRVQMYKQLDKHDHATINMNGKVVHIFTYKSLCDLMHGYPIPEE